MDKPKGHMGSQVEGWRRAPETQKAGAELNASPGVILHNCVLGKAKEGSTEVHAHGGIPAITVILEGRGGGRWKAGGEGEDRKGEGGLQPRIVDLWSGCGGRWWELQHHCLTLTYSNISIVGKVLREQTKPSGLRKPATTFGTPRRND